VIVVLNGPADGIVAIEPAPYGDRLAAGRHAAVAGLARAGVDVIVDHVLLSPAWVADLERAFAGLDVLRVGVPCPLEVAERCEAQRGDRTLGQARAQFPVVHAAISYDLTVDTAELDPAAAAARVAAALPSWTRPRPPRGSPRRCRAEPGRPPRSAAAGPARAGPHRRRVTADTAVTAVTAPAAAAVPCSPPDR
jgi:hypothetical protein